MKKYFLFCLLFATTFLSCNKAAVFSPTAQAALDDAAIQVYMNANNIKATKLPSGLYYQIITPGTGAYPTATSNIAVSYVGKLLTGTVFDTETSSYFSLATGVIEGWQIGVPLINKGGTILLLIPSALAYGITGSGLIAANTPIAFTITLQGFSN